VHGAVFLFATLWDMLSIKARLLPSFQAKWGDAESKPGRKTY